MIMQSGNHSNRRNTYMGICFSLLGSMALSPVMAVESASIDIVQQATKSIKGRVTDSAGEPIIGANVTQKGTTNGTITDVNGNFTLNVPKDAVLIVSYIGYNVQQINVSTRQTSYEITLKEDTKALDEVVVVGYGTQKKVNLTGSVSTIKADQLENRVGSNVTNLLAGQMPGVTVVQSSGQPGADTGTLRVRGIGTMNSGSSAMVIVDGVESSMGSVSPSDIDNISILKDAAASAIYGVRAANGVILITTKKGKAGKAKISYDGYAGWQEATRIPKFLGSYDFATLMNEAYKNDGTSESSLPWSADELKKFKDGSDPYNYADSDWLGTLFSEDGFFHNHHLAVNGGNEAVRYAISVGYFNKDGLIPNTNYAKISFRSNLEAKINKRLNINKS